MNELELHLERARGNALEEQRFLHALLEATVYAHVPRLDDHRRLRFAQFRHPDGFVALPFFTSQRRAEAAVAGGPVRVRAFRGREFLTLTRGAILMLDPNDGGCVLYPEEVDALLAGRVAAVQRSEPTVPPGWMGAPDTAPDWLVPRLAAAFARVPSVDAAYLLQTRRDPDIPELSFLTVMAVAIADRERAARAFLTYLAEGVYPSPDLQLDLMAFDPIQGMPEHLQQLNILPFYVRSWKAH